jgi:peptide/nickel transport system substrate-binding protein
VDSYTIRFSFEPQPEPLANLPWIPIMPAHLLRDIAPAQLRNAPFNEKPVGNGPFRFVEHRANDRWVFEANRQFPEALGGRPNVDRLVLRIVPDATAQETELRTNRVHLITSVTANKYAALDQLDGIRGVVKPGKQYVFIAWNTKRKPFDDARVRRALAFAINREKIVQVVRKNFGQVGVGPVPPFHWSTDTTIRPLPFSLDSARAYLNAIGMKDANGDGFVDAANGRPFTVELKYAAASEVQRDIAELVRADLQAIAVRVVPRGLEFGTLVEDVTSAQRNFQSAIFAFETDFKLVLHDMFHSRAVDNPYQFASYRNPTVDSLLDRLARTTSRDAAIPMWRQLQTIIRDEQPLTFLFYFPDLMAAREELKGQRGDIRGLLFNVENWWLARQDTSATSQ